MALRKYSSISRVVTLSFRQNSNDITVEPNAGTTYTGTRIFQLPPQDASSVLMSIDATQTVTGKSMSGGANTFTNISLSSSVTGVLPTANGGTGQNSTATFPTSGIVAVVPSSGVVKSNGTVLSSSTVSLTSEVSGILPGTNGGTGVSSTATYPTSGTIVTTSATQALSSKSLDSTCGITANDATFTLVDDGDITKAAQFQCSGITAGQTRLLTIPDASLTLVGTSTTQALTNKDIDGGTASNTSRITLPKASTSTISGLTRKQGTINYDTTLNAVVFDNGTSVAALSSQSQATATSLGVVKGGTVPGDISGSAIAAGYIGEKIESKASTASITNSNANITSISITAGAWLCTGIIGSKSGTATNYMDCSISTSSNTAGTLGDNRVQGPGNTTSNIANAIVPAYLLLTSSTITVYLVGSSQVALTNDAYYRLTAIRIA